MEHKNDRALYILYRLLKGEEIHISEIAEEFGVSPKSIQRDLSAIRLFLSDHRDLCNSAELLYSTKKRAYVLNSTFMLTNAEAISILRLIYGTRVFSAEAVKDITCKIVENTTRGDRKSLDTFVKGELHSYNEIHHDCNDLIENVFILTHAIADMQELSVWYYKMDRSYIERRIRPYAIIFNDFYFYLIASDDDSKLKFFRVDRIKNIVIHSRPVLPPCKEYDGMNEYTIRDRCRFMFPGEMQTIRFEFTGPSVQSILDRLPTARIISADKNKYLLEATVYGEGIKMFLLSQGAWVKVISPETLANEMKKEAEKILSIYA